MTNTNLGDVEYLFNSEAKFRNIVHPSSVCSLRGGTRLADAVLLTYYKCTGALCHGDRPRDNYESYMLDIAVINRCLRS